MLVTIFLLKKILIPKKYCNSTQLISLKPLDNIGKTEKLKYSQIYT